MKTETNILCASGVSLDLTAPNSSGEVKEMIGFFFSWGLLIWIMTLIGCVGEDYLLKERTNPYDSEYPFGMDIVNVKVLTNEDDENNHPSWSHDGTKVAYSNISEHIIYVAAVAQESFSRQPLPLADESHNWENSPRWSPTENRIAYIHGPEKNISIRDYPGGNSFQMTEDGGYIAGSLVWSPDGNKIACLQIQETEEAKFRLKILDVANRNMHVPILEDPVVSIRKICDWLPDGDRLLIITKRDDLLQACALDIQTYTPEIQVGSPQLLPIAGDLCSYAVWLAEDRKILYVASNFGRYELWMMGEHGGQKSAILTQDTYLTDKYTHVAFIGPISWSSDKSALLFVGSRQLPSSKNQIFLVEMEKR